MTVPEVTSPPPARPSAAPLMQSVEATRRAPRLLYWLTPSLLVVSDVLAVNLAVWSAWYLRYELMVGGDVEPFDQVAYEVYQPLALILSGLVVLIFLFGSLYRRHQAAFWFSDAFSILGRCGVAVMALFALTTMVRYPANSRLTYIYVWILAALLTATGRLLVQVLIGQLHRRDIGSERVLVVGDHRLGHMVMQGIAAQPHLGLHVVGFLADQRIEDFGRFRYLGSTGDVERVIRSQGIDQVIIALAAASHELQLQMVEHCRGAGVGFKAVPDLYEMSLSRVDLDTVSGVPLIDLKEVSIEGWDLVLKRTVDLLGSILALVLLSPVMFLIAMAVRLDSPGSAIYRQTRVGKGGRHFMMYKFRSMGRDADERREQLLPENEVDGPIFKKRDDPRITRVGRLIRRASLDELPQLFNVLRGDMSLVGPRPAIPSEVTLYQDWHRKRLRVQPGMTGLWQVSGRSTLSFEEMVVFDLAYIQNWSLSLDLSLLLRTLPAVIAGGGAY